jgi:hypothetical protein
MVSEVIGSPEANVVKFDFGVDVDDIVTADQDSGINNSGEKCLQMDVQQVLIW